MRFRDTIGNVNKNSIARQPFSPCRGKEEVSKENNLKDEKAVTFFLSASFLPFEINLRLAPDYD